MSGCSAVGASQSFPTSKVMAYGQYPTTGGPKAMGNNQYITSFSSTSSVAMDSHNQFTFGSGIFTAAFDQIARFDFRVFVLNGETNDTRIKLVRNGAPYTVIGEPNAGTYYSVEGHCHIKLSKGDRVRVSISGSGTTHMAFGDATRLSYQQIS